MAPNDSGWFYVHSGMLKDDVVGPIDIAKLFLLADQKTIKAHTTVMHAHHTNGQWVKFGETTALQEYLQIKAAQETLRRDAAARQHEISTAENEKRRQEVQHRQEEVRHQYEEDQRRQEENQRRHDKSQLQQRELHALAENNYPALGTLADIYRICAFLSGFTYVIGALVSFSAINQTGNPFYVACAVGLIIGGGMQVLTMFAIAEGIRLMVNVDNTLRQIRDRLPPTETKSRQ